MGQPRQGVVAVIDLNYVMNNYVKAKTIVEGLQKDGMAADTESAQGQRPDRGAQGKVEGLQARHSATSSAARKKSPSGFPT